MVNLTDIPEGVPEKNSDIIEANDISSPKITETVEIINNSKITESTQPTVLPVEEQIKMLTTGYDVLSKNYLEMRIAFNQLKLSLDDLNRKVKDLQCRNCTIAHSVRDHKHAISGETILPIELIPTCGK